MTTDEESATHSPTSAADERRQPDREEGRTGDRRRQQRLGRCGPQQRTVVSTQPLEIHLDPDLEQEEDDAHVGEQFELLAIGHIARRERRHAEPDQQVPDDRRQPEPARQPAAGRGGQQDRADLEDGSG